MTTIIEKYLTLYFGEVWKEGERYAKISALKMFLEALSAFRKIVQIYFAAFILCMFLTACSFTLLIYTLIIPTFSNPNFSLLFVSIVGGAGILAIGVILLLLREKTWLNAFGIYSKMKALEVPIRPVVRDEEYLKSLIRQMLKEQ